MHSNICSPQVVVGRCKVAGVAMVLVVVASARVAADRCKVVEGEWAAVVVTPVVEDLAARVVVGRCMVAEVKEVGSVVEVEGVMEAVLPENTRSTQLVRSRHAVDDHVITRHAKQSWHMLS